MALARWQSIIFADNISISGAILSGPVALLRFSFLIILLIWSVVGKWISHLFFWIVHFTVYADDTTSVFILLNCRGSLKKRKIKMISWPHPTSPLLWVKGI